MGQEEVLEVLEEKKEATAKIISSCLSVSIRAVNQALTRLREADEVGYKELTPEEAEKLGENRAGRKHILYIYKNGKKV